MNLSYRSIRLQSSKNYTKLLALIYSFTFFIGLQTALSLLVKVPFFLWLLYESLKLGRPQFPAGKIASIHYSHHEWWLELSTGQEEHFDRCCIIISTGLFFLLIFKRKKYMIQAIVFYDQITEVDRRFLQIQTKLHQSKA